MKSLKIKNIVVASTFVAANLYAITGNATNFMVGGVTYDITVSSSATYSSLSSSLQATPWWGNSTLAEALARHVGTSLGTPGSLGETPMFLYAPVGTQGGAAWFYVGGSYINPPLTNNNPWVFALGTSSSSFSVDLIPNAYALRSVYNIQSAALNAGLSYDCTVFDKEGMCLSTGGRYSTTNSPSASSTSGLLIGSYKYDKNIRLGAWVDQNLSTNNAEGVKLGNSKPMLGVFGVWSERYDGLGYEVKVSAGYGNKDITVTRTTDYQGSSRVNSKGIQSVSSYGIALDSQWIASPYVGLKYLSISRGGYTEGGSSPLTYNNLSQETTTVIAGVKFTGKIDPQTFTVLSAGVEHDLAHNIGQYSATSGDAVAFNSNINKTRPVVSAGVFYDIDKTQRVGLNATYRQEPFQSTSTTSALATYTVGF